MLYFIASPIGNLEDITIRALEIIKESDLVVCENTGRTSILLNEYNIRKSMIPYNDYNKDKQIKKIIKSLKDGQDIAFLTSAGSPLISDPGFSLVKEMIIENLSFDSIPGPSAAINSLILSGLPPDRFIFEGYLPRKKGRRRKIIEDFIEEEKTIILFESPKRIERLLKEFNKIIPEREIVLVREMTKIHQEIIRGKPQFLLDNLPLTKGEFTVLIGGKKWTGIH